MKLVYSGTPFFIFLNKSPIILLSLHHLTISPKGIKDSAICYLLKALMILTRRWSLMLLCMAVNTGISYLL
jgi:hypothetical protein